MVSPLWNAASDGNFDVLLALLQNASPADIEIRGVSHPRFQTLPFFIHFL